MDSVNIISTQIMIIWVAVKIVKGDPMLRLPGHLYWLDSRKFKHTTDWTQTSN